MFADFKVTLLNFFLSAGKRAGTNVSPERYAEILAEETKKWKTDYEEVKSAGGLYVIGTERHESRRIDNQLRGRSGRQGDPGRSKFFISMDDDLMRLFGGEKMKNLMSKIGMEKGDPIYHPMLNKSIERAQKKVEERNFEIRKHLLEYDDVLSEQRKFIYKQRDAILVDTNLKERVNSATQDMVMDAMDAYAEQAKRDSDGAISTLTSFLKSKFNFTLSADDVKKIGIGNTEKIEAEVTEGLRRDIEEKDNLIGGDILNQFIRMQYLQFIDRMWLDHLENMEALREAVYLRHYAQKNPLTEYKLEGFKIFDTMVDKLREEIASRVHLVRITNSQNRDIQQNRSISASHGSMAAFDATRSAAARSASMGNRAHQEKVTVVRSGPKVGRNDPCPCGSGKKYKQCHGR
ncbi:MAG: hypothetical protein Ta2G_20290 [Termitinemataceae bacterium]|nr:MAG: hypothetical protein Ta2G_20290 [Termitinemataceae bacterium]